MSERNYYVLCDDNCRFPAMTAEQIVEAIAEATGNVPEHIDDAFITKIKESNKNAALTFWKGTEAEFNALGITAAAYKVAIDANGKLYFTPGNEQTAHASTHATGGSDPVTPVSIGAADRDHTHDDYLSKSDGGTVTGAVQFNNSVGFVGTAYHYNTIVFNANSYGDTPPETGVEGQLFFVRS